MSGREAPETPQNGAEDGRKHWGKALLRWAPLVVIVLGGIAVLLLGFGDYLSLSKIVESRAALVDSVEDNLLGTIVIYFAAYVVAVVFSVPGGALLTIIGGILFGGLWGGLLTTFAATSGSVGVYLVAKTALGDWLHRRAMKMGQLAHNLDEGFRRNAFSVIVLMRLVPIMPYWASNAVPALFGVRLTTFIAATLIGLLPWTVSFAFFGEALDELVAAQEVADPGCAAAGTCALDLSAMSSGPVITGVAIALAALIPVGYLWWSRRRKGADAVDSEADTGI